MEKRSKRGASHVEFVLSFMIFVVFLIFLYNGLEPIVQSAGSKQFVLGHLQLSLIENLTLSDFTIQTFTINAIDITIKENGQDCLKIAGGALNKIFAEDKDLTIKNSSGNILQYDYQGNSILISPVKENPSSGDFFKVYSATSFDSSSRIYDLDPNCKFQTSKYDVKSVVEKEVISESNVNDIAGWYDTIYDEFNIDLGVPSGSDWNFEFQTIEFIDEGGDILPIGPATGRIPPENTNIYVGEFPIQYIDKTATTKIGFIKITVW